MNRTILTVAGVLSASSLLLVDSAIKGTVLLTFAAVAALFLRRDSAATRHLVWLLAIVAMLVVPVLSAMLPQWRVLPAWMSSSRPVVADVSPPSIVSPASGVIESPQMAAPAEVERPSATAFPPAAVQSDSQPALVTPAAVPAPTVWSWNWINALPLAWAIGFSVLILRLSAARWMLWNSERLATVIRGRVAPQLAFESRSDSATEYDHIVTAMETICSQLGIGRPVTLLIHPNKTIPVVWGILRCRLMLPAAARQWNDEQLRSVLLHELAHIKRRDTIVQLLAQVACALHWFNPLVWFAAWRLEVERERSCDDLVLASGIRPSAYAGHLLDVVTGHSPARWTQACGLAMARKSSLEGRLTAVLGKDLNRRSVSVALAGLALAIAVGVAVPIAMLRAADEKWNPPRAAHVGSNDFSSYCVHDGKDVAWVIAYHGDFNSATESSSNAKTRTWTDSGTLTVKKTSIALGFHRSHAAPDKLVISITPAEDLDLSKPAPPPRKFGQKEYDLTKGRVFLLSDSGSIRQLDLATPVVTDQESAKRLAALIAAVPPPQRDDSSLNSKTAMKLEPETIAKLKWGEPVNGLRMALAWPPSLGDALLGKEPFFQLVLQNVSEKEIHFSASDRAPNPRELVFRAENRTVLVLGDEEVSAADWHLQPGHSGMLRMFTREWPEKDGKTISAGVEGDLSKIDRNHAVAVMEIAKAPAGAWTGKLVTGPTRGSADVAAAPAPMHKDSRSLYEVWQRFARANGDIPGGLIGELAGSVKQFIKLNPTWETVPKLNAILPRLDATHDWKPADAIALLDEVAAVKDSPLRMAIWKATRLTIRKGEALPEKFADAPWGEAQPSGLRAAWVLEPGGAEHRIGAVLRARLLVQNRGQVPVMLQVPTWHQGWVKASDAEGKEVEASGLERMTLGQLFPCRLAPGEYIEINTPGVGIGPSAGMGPWAGPSVGSNVLAKPGDELTLTHSPVPLDGSDVGRSEEAPQVFGPGWWLAHIKARLARELPLPADAAERARLLDRAVRELFAVAPTAEETAAFTADQTPGAFDTLVKRLATRADAVEFSGSLPTAPAKFRVLAADPVADKTPRVVIGPGEYPLPSASSRRGDATLKIVGRPVGDRRTNDAQLLFEATEFTGLIAPEPHKLEVPDGWGTWAIVCRPSDGFFYLLHKGVARKIDFTNPRKVTDTPAADLPAEFRDEVKRQFEIAGVSAEQQAEVFEKPAPPAATADSDAVNAVRTAAAPGRYELGDGVQLQVRQATENGKPTNSAQILFLSPDPKVQPKVPHLEKLPVISSTNRAPTQKAMPGEPYDIEFHVPDADYAFVWQCGANTLWLIEISEGRRILIWRAPGGTRPGPQMVTLRSFDFSNPADVKLTHVTSSENGGDWSWGKIVPAAFHQPVLDALGERGNRLRDFIEPQKEKPKGAAVKLTPDALLGFWRGTMDGRDLMISFHRPPVEKDVLLHIYFSRSTIGRLATFNIAPDGGSALVVLEGAGNAVLGTLRPIDANTIRLEDPDKEGKAAAIAMLKRDVEPPATEPRQKEARELFEMWKRTANEDGTIPGTFIGQLSTEVRAHVKANPNSDSGMNLPKLLPRFVTSRDWTQAEAIKLLDDLAYYSTQPIAARVAKAKLPSSPLWRTEVEFADIPVKIAKWSEAKDGLRIGMRVQGDWQIGGKVRIELWLHNAGGKDVAFKTTGPNRQDVGVAVSVVGSDGSEQHAENGNVLILAIPTNCTLPAGHVAMAKSLEVTFAEPGNDVKAWMAPRFRDLKPGKYQLRCKWVDANATVSKPGDWTGELTAPDHAFTLASAVAAGDLEAKLAPKLAKLPPAAAVAAPQVAETPKTAEQEPFTAWGKEVGGLQAGLGFKAGEKRVYAHGETVRLVVRVRNVGKEEAQFQYLRQFFIENQPTVTDGNGNLKQLGKVDAFGEHFPVKVKLAPGKEIELYEWTPYLGSGTEEGKPKHPSIFGTGKLQVQYEKVLGDSSSTVLKLDPALSKLATGKLELEIKPVPPVQQETPKPKSGAASPIRARDAWSKELLALAKTVAESRGMAAAKARLGEQVTPLLVLKNVSGATKTA